MDFAYSENIIKDYGTNMSKVFTDVSVFLTACGQEYPKTPDPQVSDLAELYKKLIKEEVEEFWEAEAVSDDAEQLDACFDMMWVIIGYMKARGWDCAAAWDEGAKSNLAKIDRNTGMVRRREDGKILKPDGWTPPNFSKFVR
jgi:predicted HAD superfamily Cof-like phosphohydrolase